MQPVPCLRISERPVRVPSNQNTRWRPPFYTKQKPRNKSRVAATPRGCDRMATPLGTLGLGLDLFVYAMNFLFSDCYLLILCLKALACIFTFCHTWYNYSSLYYYYLFGHTTLNFKLSGGLAACLMTWVKV
jgi:hypothetical protein